MLLQQNMLTKPFGDMVKKKVNQAIAVYMRLKAVPNLHQEAADICGSNVKPRSSFTRSAADAGWWQRTMSEQEHVAQQHVTLRLPPSRLAPALKMFKFGCNAR